MPKFTDTKILEYLESPSFRNDTFSDWARREHDYETSDDPVILATEKAHFSIERSNKDALEGLSGIRDMENELLVVLAKMEHRGVYVEKSELREIAEELREKSRALETEMYELVGEVFNPGSAKQVQYILYEKLGITKGKKIKTGFSVDSEALELISKDYAIADLILSYRTYEKLRATYAEGLAKEIAMDGRIHTTYKQTATSTGRLASEAPNLQNIPSGSWYPDRIKSTFRPAESGSVFVVADYSQVELRILAIMSWDENLIDAFVHGEDIHERTARFIFPGAATISSEQRRIAKAVNFGVIYGISGFGLSKMIGTSPKESNAYIEAFFSKYQKVRNYYDTLLENARKCGYVETYFGRRRVIKWLNDANSMMRQAAEREAMNAPIQGTAADVIKLAMIQIDRKLENELPDAHMLMQVHDELVFEAPEKDQEKLQAIIRETMEGVLPHDKVTLKVDIGVGANWCEAKG